MLLAFYSFALFLVLVLGLPYWLLRLITSGKYREGLGERLGGVPARLHANREQPTVWVHAVSVGEAIAVSRLVEEFLKRAPGARLVLSTTTRAGQKLARERFGRDRTFYFPLDFAWIVRRYLRALKPSILVLVESEFWPNLLVECHKASIPVAVVNGRISDRSLPRYLRLRGWWKKILANVTVVLAQSQEDAKRFKAIGVPAERVFDCGNLKFDVRAAENSAAAAVIRAHIPAGLQVLVCGSTVEGEDALLLEAFRELRKSTPELLMILAPRHPERFGPVAELIHSRGEESVRRSEWMEKPSALRAGTVILLDSVGELASVYSLASVAFIGKSLLESGGHNPLEPAQFGIPIVMGPHYENFRGVVEQLLENEAIKLATTETLIPILSALLRDKEAGSLLGLRALEVFDSRAGATERAIQVLLPLLPPEAIRERASKREAGRSTGE